jgi:uncharacterized protein (DUF2236 family)
MRERAAAAVVGEPAPSGAAPAVSWRLHREVVLLAGWTRAILLQLAHPLVARGVADHSRFAAEPWGRVRRLRRTLDAMLALSFGTEADAARVARSINAIHDRVNGELPATAGGYPARTRYSAHDPALLAWVHATLVDSFLLTYELLVGPLAPDEQDRYCLEATAIEPRLGIPAGRLPRTRAALDEFLGERLESGEIVVTDAARALAAEVLRPPVPRVLGWAAAPVFAVAALPSIGLLPPAIREGYGLAWNSRHERMLAVLARLTRLVLPLVPPPLRYWRTSRRAQSKA